MTKENIINMLKEYLENDRMIEILKEEMKCIEETGVSAIDYSLDRISKTYKFSSQTENSAMINIIDKDKHQEQLEELQNDIKVLNHRIKIADNMLHLLANDERDVIYKYYVEGKTFEQINREMYLTYKQIRNRRDTGIDNLYMKMNKRKKVG